MRWPKKLSADLLLIDDKAGRDEAQRVGLAIMGFAGLLPEAKKMGLIAAVKPYLDEAMQKIRFRISPRIYTTALEEAGEL